jgi:serine/threonine-protein kinase
MLLTEGTLVAGRFKLNRLLGQGGMGSVWHATHVGLDIPCAVKFIEGSSADHPGAQARFEREAKAAAQLRSPHVVQILDHGVCEGTPYIAMELLEGEDLGKRLERVLVMAPAEVHSVMNQVCRALTKAHPLGIVHRDLKPDNIFLVRDDDREVAKVLDFGIAKSQSTELGGGNTKTGAMLGTPYYMSPEQAQGTKTVDFRSDLWSLAVITFRAFTGRLPFESDALGDLLIKIIVSDLPIPSQVAPVPSGFDAWWKRAASRDPAARFQSAKAFADSLALVCQVSQVSGVNSIPGYGGMPAGSVTGDPSSRSYPGPLSASNPAASAPESMQLAATARPLSHTVAREDEGKPGKGLVAVIAAASVLTLLVVGGGLVLVLQTFRGDPPVVVIGSTVPSANAAPVVTAGAPTAPTVASPPAGVTSPGVSPPGVSPPARATAVSSTAPAVAPPAASSPSAKPGAAPRPQAPLPAAPAKAPGKQDMGF